MCGRFSLNITLEQIQQHFSVDVVTCEREPRPEVFPSQQVPAIIMHESGKRLGLLTWGLIPSWTKEKKGTGHINARAETVFVIVRHLGEGKTDPDRFMADAFNRHGIASAAYVSSVDRVESQGASGAGPV